MSIRHYVPLSGSPDWAAGVVANRKLMMGEQRRSMGNASFRNEGSVGKVWVDGGGLRYFVFHAGKPVDHEAGSNLYIGLQSVYGGIYDPVISEQLFSGSKIYRGLAYETIISLDLSSIPIWTTEKLIDKYWFILFEEVSKITRTKNINFFKGYIAIICASELIHLKEYASKLAGNCPYYVLKLIKYFEDYGGMFYALYSVGNYLYTQFLNRCEYSELVGDLTYYDEGSAFADCSFGYVGHAGIKATSKVSTEITAGSSIVGYDTITREYSDGYGNIMSYAFNVPYIVGDKSSLVYHKYDDIVIQAYPSHSSVMDMIVTFDLTNGCYSWCFVDTSYNPGTSDVIVNINPCPDSIHINTSVKSVYATSVMNGRTTVYTTLGENQYGDPSWIVTGATFYYDLDIVEFIDNVVVLANKETKSTTQGGGTQSFDVFGTPETLAYVNYSYNIYTQDECIKYNVGLITAIAPDVSYTTMFGAIGADYGGDKEAQYHIFAYCSTLDEIVKPNYFTVTRSKDQITNEYVNKFNPVGKTEINKYAEEAYEKFRSREILFL